MDALQKVYAISKEREAQGVKVTPPTWVVTRCPIGHTMPTIVEDSSVSLGPEEPSFGDGDQG